MMERWYKVAPVLDFCVLGKTAEESIQSVLCCFSWEVQGWNQTSCVQSLSCIQFFVTPWTAAHQASLSFTVSQSLLKLLSIE